MENQMKPNISDLTTRSKIVDGVRRFMTKGCNGTTDSRYANWRETDDFELGWYAELGWRAYKVTKSPVGIWVGEDGVVRDLSDPDPSIVFIGRSNSGETLKYASGNEIIYDYPPIFINAKTKRETIQRYCLSMPAEALGVDRWYRKSDGTITNDPSSAEWVRDPFTLTQTNDWQIYPKVKTVKLTLYYYSRVINGSIEYSDKYSITPLDHKAGWIREYTSLDLNLEDFDFEKRYNIEKSEVLEYLDEVVAHVTRYNQNGKYSFIKPQDFDESKIEPFTITRGDLLVSDEDFFAKHHVMRAVVLPFIRNYKIKVYLSKCAAGYWDRNPYADRASASRHLTKEEAETMVDSVAEEEIILVDLTLNDARFYDAHRIQRSDVVSNMRRRLAKEMADRLVKSMEKVEVFRILEGTELWNLGFRTGVRKNDVMISAYVDDLVDDSTYYLVDGKITTNKALAEALGDFEIMPAASAFNEKGFRIQ
jgi:hypothetical protein